MKKYIVYVLQNNADQFYKGYTTDLQKRIAEHNTVSGKWTSTRGPWRLVFYKEFQNKSEALRYEKYLKSGPGRRFLKDTVQ